MANQLFWHSILLLSNLIFFFFEKFGLKQLENNHKHSKERVNENLINLNDNTVESFTNIDNGVPLDKFHDALYQSSHQYLPAWNTDRKSAGFDAPISPLDRNKFQPGCNDGIQGATKEIPQDQETYMAGISQHFVQN